MDIIKYTETFKLKNVEQNQNGIEEKICLT